MAKDLYHKNVREALEKDGWVVTHDPYPLDEWNPDWEIDFGAEKMIAAERDTDKIAVEVKTFGAESFAYEFHRALGQYMNYLAGLETLDPGRKLFLAVPKGVYESEFQRRGIRVSLEKYQVHLLVFEPSTNSIERWIQ